MLIEHTFVTTLEAPQAFSLACSFLNGIGFRISNLPASLDQPLPQSLEMTRGNGPHCDPRRALQSVHLAFDRGRITIAASILPARRGSFGLNSSSLSGIEPPASSKLARPHAQLMVALAEALEALLSRGQSPQEASRSWLALEEAEIRKAQRARHSSMIKGIMISFAAFLLILCLIGSASRQSRTRETRPLYSPDPHISDTPSGTGQ
jgi:hypothetical protein